MAEYMGRAEGHTNSVTRRYPVTDGDDVADGDFVKLVSGRISLAGAGDEILGTVVGGDTGNLDRAHGLSATGDADGTVQVLVNIEKDARYLVKCDATVADSHVGGKFDLNGGGSGEQQVALGAAGTQLLVLDKGVGLRGADATYAIVEVIGGEGTQR